MLHLPADFLAPLTISESWRNPASGIESFTRFANHELELPLPFRLRRSGAIEGGLAGQIITAYVAEFLQTAPSA